MVNHAWQVRLNFIGNHIEKKVRLTGEWLSMEKLVFTEDIHTFHIDFAGHVSNITYIQWMEVGRLKLLEAVGLSVTTIRETLGLLPTLIRTEIDYKRQLFLRDGQVRVEVRLSHLRNVSAVMEFRFYNKAGKLTASGRQTGLFIDAKSFMPTALGSEQHTAFAPYVADEAKKAEAG